MGRFRVRQIWLSSIGPERSAVFDLADLYKAEYAIPAAATIEADGGDDIGDHPPCGPRRRACWKSVGALLL